MPVRRRSNGGSTNGKLRADRRLGERALLRGWPRCVTISISELTQG
jgi:hypothetical protein